MSSSIITPVAEQLRSYLASIGLNVPKRWAPRDINPPAAVVELPRIERSSPDGSEDVSLSANGWLITYPVTLYFELTEAYTAQESASDVVEAFIQLIDANRGIGGLALDASVVGCEPALVLDQTRALFAYECQVAILKEVAYP